MNKLTTAAIAASASLSAYAGDSIQMIQADEPGVMSLMLVSMAIVAAIKLQSKFKK